MFPESVEQPPALIKAEEDNTIDNQSVVSRNTALSLSTVSYKNQKSFQIYRSEKLNKLRKSSNPLKHQSSRNYNYISKSLMQKNPTQQRVLNDLNESQDTAVSTQFNQDRLNRLNEERQTEQNKLFNNFGDDSLHNLYEQLRIAQRQKEEFAQQQQENRNNKFVEDTTEQFTFLESQLYKVVLQLEDVTQYVIEKIKQTQENTKNLFIFSSHYTQSDLRKLGQQQENTSKSLIELINDLKSTDEAIDILITKVTELNDEQESEKNSVHKVLQELISYVKGEISTLFNQVISIKDKNSQNYSLIIQSQQDKINQLQSENNQQTIILQEVMKRVSTLESTFYDSQKKTDVAYFTSNMLLDNDKMLKEGMDESTAKQAYLLDLVTKFVKDNNVQPTQDNPNPKSQAAKQFQDSVQSLKLGKAVRKDFADIQKIPEFLNYDPTTKDERMEVESRVFDKHYPEYQQKVEQYFNQYPKVSQFFMVGQGKPENNEPQEQLEGSKQPFEEKPQVNPLDQMFNDLKSTNEQFNNFNNQEIPLKPRFEEENGQRFTYKQQQPEPNKFNYEELLRALQPEQQRHFNQGLKYAPIERHYHKFQFKEKFTRNTHPKIFLLQFETLAQQCGLLETEMCTQFMFALQGEYLDWYKARYINNPNQLTWYQLKTSFLETYTKDQQEAEEDLMRITQKQNESAYTFLQRLRDAVNTSDLSDDHIKKQFCSGLSNQKAKSYIYNMKQFNPILYKKHTTTTLLLELEKQAKLFNFDLGSKTTEKNQSITKNNNSNRYNSSRYRSAKQYSSNRPITEVKETTKVEPQQTKSYQDKSKSYNNKYKKVYPKKVNFVQDDEQNNENDNISLSSHSSLSYTYEPDTSKSQLINDSQSDENEQNEQMQLIFAGPSIPASTAQINSLNTTHETQAGEGEQVHSLFRNSQKNAQNLHEKLSELVQKGKHLQQVDYQTLRSNMYLHLPDEQVLIESPKQFLSATNYLLSCLKNNDNLLQTSSTQKSFQATMDQLVARMKSLNVNEDASSTKAQQGTMVNNICIDESLTQDQCNLAIMVKPIDFLYYIKIKFEGKSITALVDTGSTVTVISSHFCNRHNIIIPKCDTMREVTLADGSKTKMLEWKNAKITLDEYNTILCDVLISQSKSYDLLFGLNTCLAIGASLYPDFLRYYFKVNDKERFGKLPIEKQTRKSVVRSINP